MGDTFGSAPDTAFKFATVEFPGASDTTATGINDRGQIVGAYVDSAGQTHGYLDTHGRFTTIDVPGATLTVAYGINDRGQIVGDYVDSTGTHGFVDTKGRFTTIDPPGATLTQAFGINDRGQIVGIYSDSTGTHGFVDTNGSFSAVEFPGASSATFPLGINNRGQIVGIWLEDRGMGGPPPHGLIIHSFLDNNGTFTTLDPAGAAFAEAFGVNNRGQIVGVDVANMVQHGFVDTRGTFTNITPPGGGALAESFAPSMGLNNRGQIVGTIIDSTGTHGFVASPTPDRFHSGDMKPDTIGASVTLLGQYMQANFKTSDDAYGGTLVADPSVIAPTDQQPNTLANLHMG